MGPLGGHERYLFIERSLSWKGGGGGGGNTVSSLKKN